MGHTASNEPRLIVLRGNSASGKSAIAERIRDRYGRGIAIVGQDNIRRTILRELDTPGASTIGLIDLTARYVLDHGYHVIVEGIMHADRYGDMLHHLHEDYRDRAFFYYLDVTFEETLRRHTTKPQAVEYGEAEMREWYRERDLLPSVEERCLPESTGLDEAVDLIFAETRLDIRR